MRGDIMIILLYGYKDLNIWNVWYILTKILHIHTYIYICVCIYVYICIYIYTLYWCNRFVHMHIYNIYIYVYIRIYIYMYYVYTLYVVYTVYACVCLCILCMHIIFQVVASSIIVFIVHVWNDVENLSWCWTLASRPFSSGAVQPTSE